MSSDGADHDLLHGLRPDYFADVDPRAYAKFFRFHTQHPVVYEALRAMAFEKLAQGYQKFGAMTFYQNLRWKEDVQTGARPYKLPNDLQPCYSRLLMDQNPELRGFFVTRRCRKRDPLRPIEGWPFQDAGWFEPNPHEYTRSEPDKPVPRILRIDRKSPQQDGSFYLQLWLMGGNSDAIFVPGPPADGNQYDSRTCTAEYQLHRWRRKQKAGCRCERIIGARCLSRVRLHVHHLTYERFGGDELDSDWEVLCPSHHGIVELEKLVCLGCGRSPTSRSCELQWCRMMHDHHWRWGDCVDITIWRQVGEYAARAFGNRCDNCRQPSEPGESSEPRPDPVRPAGPPDVHCDGGN